MTIVLQVIALAALAIGSARNICVGKSVVHGNRSHVRAGEHALFLFIATGASSSFVTKPGL